MESAKHGLTENQAIDLMMKNCDYIKEVNEDGQLQEIPITPPTPAPKHAASSKTCPRARELMTSTPNASSKRPRTELDAHQLRVYKEGLMEDSSHALQIMGSACREMAETCRSMSLTKLKDPDKYDEVRIELQKKLADWRQESGTDEDLS